MSNAKKCDRCGALYEPYCMSSNDPMVHDKCKLMDLCPECFKSLKRWIKMGEVKADDNGSCMD